MSGITVTEQSRPVSTQDTARTATLADISPYSIAHPIGYETAKRALDYVGALAGLLIVLPICTVIAILVKLDSRGPILFRQKRPGKDGRPFTILKFRTMRKDAEEKLAQVTDIHDTEDPLIRVEADPRVTRLGRLLRMTSIDELPQLINVLRGEMSLVGPRPISRPIHDPRDPLRLKVRPGITGLWQISGRKNGNTDFMLGRDMAYLQRRSLSFDLLLLLKTVKAVMKADGAR